MVNTGHKYLNKLRIFLLFSKILETIKDFERENFQISILVWQLLISRNLAFQTTKHDFLYQLHYNLYSSWVMFLIF